MKKKPVKKDRRRRNIIFKYFYGGTFVTTKQLSQNWRNTRTPSTKEFSHVKLELEVIFCYNLYNENKRTSSDHNFKYINCESVKP